MKKDIIGKNKVKRSFGSRIAEHFKSLDLYGKSIMLTYEGNEKFKTHIGALISLCILMMVTTYLILQLRVMILNNNTSFSKNSLQKDLTNDNEVHYIGDRHINLGFKIDYNGDNLLTDSSYFTYSIKQVSQLYIQQGDSVLNQRIKSNLPVDQCMISSFDLTSQALYDRLSVGEYICPIMKNYTIAANYYAPRFDYIEVKVFRCNPALSSVTCKTNITDVMMQTQLSLLISNNFIDFNNYVNPVQNFLDDKYFWDFAPGLRKKVDIYIRKNGANFTDDYIQLGQSNQLSFYQVSSMRESVVIEDTDLQIVSVYFRLDANYDNYYRRVYSIGDLLGQTGGLYSSVLMIGGFIVGIFSERLFVSSILHKIYQIDHNRDNEIRNKILQNKGKMAVHPHSKKFY